MGNERRDTGARAARERLATLLDVEARWLGRITEEQALAMAAELNDRRSRPLPARLVIRRVGS